MKTEPNLNRRWDFLLDALSPWAGGLLFWGLLALVALLLVIERPLG